MTTDWRLWYQRGRTIDEMCEIVRSYEPPRHKPMYRDRTRDKAIAVAVLMGERVKDICAKHGLSGTRVREIHWSAVYEAITQHEKRCLMSKFVEIYPNSIPAAPPPPLSGKERFERMKAKHGWPTVRPGLTITRGTE